MFKNKFNLHVGFSLKIIQCRNGMEEGHDRNSIQLIWARNGMVWLSLATVALSFKTSLYC